ncbi:molybdenum cofactor biosynthesis protein B [Pelagibacteraceae bacterium]|jgi:molybdenum cofactor biosynthesis protein B|nr:molybdenum cofactor biosynthesis protein B [Pelagibacteraceae bacterium]MDC1148636.1 molybdenum cofactor biosynthesis protein B [Pelagibacteraceae bacterium]
MPIDSTKDFKPINVSVLTISDTRTEATDKSGQILAKKIKEKGHGLAHKVIVKDEKEEIKKILLEWCNDKDVDVILTTGGTGLTGRDTTPEALEEIKDKDIPGFGELFRLISYKKIGASTIQSRAMAVLAKGTYVFALPGSSGAVTDAWEDILKYQLDSRFRPCNFIELIPRLNEK